MKSKSIIWKQFYIPFAEFNLFTLASNQIRQIYDSFVTKDPQPVTGAVPLSVRPAGRVVYRKKLTYKPVLVELFAGEASISSAFHDFGWKCYVNELEEAKIVWSEGVATNGLPKKSEDVTLLIKDFMKIDWDKELPEEIDFAWFANDCSTFSYINNLNCKCGSGRTNENPEGTTEQAWEANRILDHTVQQIRKKSLSEFKNRTWFTFAIENPDGWMEQQSVVQELLRDPKIKACVVKFDQCHFGRRRSGQDMGEFKKRTIMITNNEGIINHFGTKEKTWHPHAPDPQYICCKERPCQSYNQHKHAMAPGFDGRALDNGDRHSSELAPYPQAMPACIANAVNNWWLSNVAKAKLKSAS